MWTRFDIGIAIAKLLICIGGGVIAWQWHLALHDSAAGRPDLMSHMPLYDALLAIGVLAGLLAVVGLTRDNARRVVLNTLVISGCTILLVIVGNLVWNIRFGPSYEIVERTLYLGIVGAAFGMLLTLIGSALRIVMPIAPPRK